ncbi:MAG: hypothetical protein WC645_01355 [Candidatus Margulisiibacteriota bacterium]
MLKKWLLPILLVVLVIIFWHPVLFNNEFFYDDLDFIKVFESGQFSLPYMFTPHNEHFMPIFKMKFFLLYKMFGVNIVPPMILSIALHIANCLLFFYLCTLLFPGRKWLPFLTAVFFAVNSAYFEVIHWFIVINTASSLFFLLATLILLHRYALDKKNWQLWLSLAASFFIPMGFSLGLMGVAFVILYAWLVLKLPAIKIAVKYLAVWLAFLVIYGIFVVGAGKVGGGSFTFDILRIIQYIFFGFLGAFLKTMGFNIMVFPWSTVLAIILAIQLVFLGYFFVLYFFLNRKEERAPVLGERGIVRFCLLSALISYAAVAVTRSSLGVDAFLSWGRYHYFPVFFLSILAGSAVTPIYNILSKIFNRRRVMIYFILLFALYLATQLILIRQKAFSSIRLEGSLPKIEIPA